MAIIRPFKAYRPIEEVVLDVAAPPYDVVNTDEARVLVEGNKYSFLRIDKSEINLSKDIDQYDNRVYECARDLLNSMIEEGIYIEEKRECLYIYREIIKGISQTGLVMCTSVDEYIDKKIKVHENIRPEKEIDRIKHIEYCAAHTGPIFMIYRENIEITNIINKWTNNEPIYSFKTEDDINHIIWRIDDTNDIEALRNLFANIKDLYIADGHHRSSAAVKVALNNRTKATAIIGEEEINYFLSIAYPDNEVNVLEYNRVVKDLNGYTKIEFINKVKNNFIVTKSLNNESISPSKKGEFGMYLDKEWYVLQVKDEVINEKTAIGKLDVSILQNYLLSSILGIDDPTKSDRIDFIGGIRGVKELERRVNSDMKVGFSLYPVSVDEIMAIADEGKIMPPKSTWFEPKPRSGIFIHKFK